MGAHDAALETVDLAAGLQRTQAAELVWVDNVAVGIGSGQQVRAV